MKAHELRLPLSGKKNTFLMVGVLTSCENIFSVVFVVFGSLASNLCGGEENCSSKLMWTCCMPYLLCVVLSSRGNRCDKSGPLCSCC